MIQAALGGAVATTVLEGDRQFDVAVRFPAQYRDSIEKIRNIKVAIPTGSGANAYIPLSELATITLDTGAALDLSREHAALHPDQVQRARTRPGEHCGGSAGAHCAKSVKLPSGYRMVWAGEFGDLQEAKERLAIVVPVSLLLIVGLLYSLFNSLLGMPADSFGHSLRHRRRRAGALRLRA